MDYLLNYGERDSDELVIMVLNLIINGLPSKLDGKAVASNSDWTFVLNLIINGLPSKLAWLHQGELVR